MVPRRLAADGVGVFCKDGRAAGGSGVAVEPRRITATGSTWLGLEATSAAGAICKENHHVFFRLFLFYSSIKYILCHMRFFYSLNFSLEKWKIVGKRTTERVYVYQENN